MKTVANVAGALLGFIFVVFGLNYFLRFIPIPPPPEGSPAAMFMGALYSSGFLAFVKILEIAGGILVAFPRTRPIGLLLLTPIIVNIVAYHIFIARGGLFEPPVVLSTVAAAFLIWVHRRGVAALIADRAA
ncbi:MAG: hypothetical protein NZ740_00955 [Kiritimatiellae bacterium]|nr:hypothetical protein [Kiritimatiellia bacterium]MDW8457659.1 hypothetical protein [Verrucomicrobiota bacterium]